MYIFSHTVDLKINSALSANVSKRSNVYLSCYSECFIITFVILDVFFLFKFEPSNYEQIGNIRVVITHVIIEYE